MKECDHYCIDTSALILWWVERYGPETFESLPQKISSLIEEGRMCASRSVKDERKDDPTSEDVTLAKWCREQSGFYEEDDADVQKIASALLQKYQTPKKKHGIDGADPFVIARAAINGVGWCVVSAENPATGNPQKNPNIPFVCAGEGIEHIDFYNMMRREGWKFG